MSKFQTASYFAKPKTKAADIHLSQPIIEHLEQAVAIAIDSLMEDPFYPPRAMFPCVYVGDALDKEPPSALLVSFPMADPDEPAELRIDMDAIADEALWMHQDDRGCVFDPEARDALSALAAMFEAQAKKLRDGLSQGPTHG